ncbi:MAG: oligoendopeptidase F [Eubacteriales bacterium]|nr:oligoendopeptidase F [Eubacteriales bacterium]
MKRQEQKIENTWNMQDMYENEELFRSDAGKLEKQMEEFKSIQGSLGQSADQFLKVLKLHEQMNMVFEKLYVYANQKYHEDTTDARYQQMSGEMQIAAAKLSQSMSWMEPELLSLPKEKLEKYFEEQPELSDYRWFVKQITRQREHVLDAQTEELLARVSEIGQMPSTIFSMFNNADIRFPDAADGEGKKHTVTQGSFVSMLKSKDRTLRKSAFEALYSVYGQYANTLASIYYANAKQADFFAKERHYAGAMEEALSSNAIPMEVYENLIKTINKRMSGMYRYIGLRKKLLGLDELHMYDVYVPMVESPQKKYTFDEAKEIVKKALAPMGEDYLALLQEGFDHRWIDVYENEGKRTGAYSWGAYGTHPYVLLNYQGTLDDVFTLAHEMGHALHTWYSNQKQPYRYAGYRIFVAEVASTCNEALLIHYLLEHSGNDTERKYLINHFLDQFKGTMYRQTMFAQFEMATHRDMVQAGGVLTAGMLCNTYLNLNRQYFGDEMISDEEIQYEWARIPHFYTPFYVYQYATGFAAAITISSRILAGEAGIVEKYKEFLSSGSSRDPIDLLKICGVDMSVSQPVEAALDVFEEYLAKLEAMV